ncbi:MAG: TonB-dependent receptor plug domain-containing protein [Hyphomonas sp.]|uniref:TonB-dependent receptor plug domain-containing protein n=1 Tax=Hyphomonas sp. TaxID=87 RepID=UPI003002B2EC
MKFKNMLALSASAVVFAAGAAIAQEQDAAPERENAVSRVLGTVTVTATKKANVENVQDVPVAVTAFNSDTLDALNVTTLESLSYSAPNVSLDDVGTARGTANFAIRGLGVNSSIPSIDPAVGVFIDGVYLGVNSGVVVDLFDIDSIEVLRGPQGLLFGRNTTGGALVVNTGNPTDEFHYKLRASVDGPVDSDRGGANSTVQGTISGPLVEGKLNGKLGVAYNSDAGYFKNQFNGDNHGEAQTATYRGALEFMPTDALTFLGKLEYTDSYTDGPTGQNRSIYDRYSFDFAINNPGFSDSTTTLGSLKTDLDVDFGNGVITNIFGYRKYDSTSSGDIDATPLTLFHSNAELAQEQFSDELRYAGTFGKADVTTG